MRSTGARSRGQERLPQVPCCRFGGETGGVGLGGQRERRSVGNLPGFQAGLDWGLTGYASWSWGVGQSNKRQEGG